VDPVGPQVDVGRLARSRVGNVRRSACDASVNLVITVAESSAVEPRAGSTRVRSPWPRARAVTAATASR
jgi:hypothetical protein